MDCVERMEITRYPPLASQARIEGSITASVALSSDGAVHDIKITAESKYKQAKNLFGPPVEKVIRAAQFHSGCSEKTIKLRFILISRDSRDSKSVDVLRIPKCVLDHLGGTPGSAVGSSKWQG